VKSERKKEWRERGPEKEENMLWCIEEMKWNGRRNERLRR